MMSTQHCFINGKSCITNLVNLFDEMTGLVDMVKAEAVVYLDYSSACGTLSYTSSIKELLMDEKTVK